MSNPTAQSTSPSEVAVDTSASTSTTPQTIEIHIPSSTEFVRVVRLAIWGVASRMSFSYDDVEDIKLAVSEACNNAILHATAPALNEKDSKKRGKQGEDSQQGSIMITVTPWPDRLEICVTDEGRVPPPGLPKPKRRTHSQAEAAENLRESGLGLYLMEALMDRVEHVTGSDANTSVFMVKYVPGSPHKKVTRPSE